MRESDSRIVQGSLLSSAWLAVRSLLWAIVVPGIVAGYVPWRFFGLRTIRIDPLNPVHLIAVLTIVAGAILLATCIVDFARHGRGTLAPIDAPRRLVVQGLYRHVRNPMYLSVTVILFGELLVTRSLALLTYWMTWFAVVNFILIAYEEPTLRKRFGAAYDRYTREVGRWIPRRVPADPE